MNTIAEQVLCKHKGEGLDLATLADGLATDVLDSNDSKTYIYDDDSYTTIFNGGERHKTGVNIEVEEFTSINTEYLSARQKVFYEHEQDDEIQQQGPSPTKDPIIKDAINKHKAIVAYCIKRYTNNLRRRPTSVFPSNLREGKTSLLKPALASTFME